MRVLVIPDIHLKPWIFGRARELMTRERVDHAVCLMDIADDFHQERNLELYRDTYQAATVFSKDFPDTLWCWGNHDLSYIWEKEESGYSTLLAPGIRYIVSRLADELNNLAYIHRIDDVLFMHGGLEDYFVQNYAQRFYNSPIDDVITEINALGPEEIWKYGSPIWHRPQKSPIPMFREEKFLYVVGHTPMKKITRSGNVISTDVFSTNWDGTPIGNRTFMILDTETWEYKEFQ